jgi:hypothetical protein
MADERRVPLSKPGENVSIAVTPDDFFKARVVRKDGAPIDAQAGGEHFMTYAEAGYRLTDYYEDKTPYEGPKTKQAAAYRERKAAEETAASKADDKPKPAEAKKD